jgi:hypothetical protein
MEQTKKEIKENIKPLKALLIIILVFLVGVCRWYVQYPCSPTPIPTTGKINSGTVITWFNPKPWIWTAPDGTVWHDASAERRNEGPYASGLPANTPGVALPNKETLGEWVKITLPDGRVVVTQQVDIGPSGGILDISAPLAAQLYLDGPSTIKPGPWIAERIGRELPSGVNPGIQG